MAPFAPWQAQQIKTTYLKHKTLHNPPVCIMEPGLATIGRAAKEARADDLEESGTESDSDGAPDSPTGSALGSSRKRPNSLNLVFEKFGSGKTDNAIHTFKESRDTFLDSHARKHRVLDYPFGKYSLCVLCFHYKEKPQLKLQSIILNFPFQYRAK